MRAVSELPPPTVPADDHDDRFVTPPTLIPTRELLFRFRRLVIAMAVAAVVMAVLPIPSAVHVIVLLAVPMFILIIAIKDHDFHHDRYLNRYIVRLWRFRHDRDLLLEAGERSRDPVQRGMRRAWLLLGLFVAVFMIGLVMAGASAGISEGLYG